MTSSETRAAGPTLAALVKDYGERVEKDRPAGSWRDRLIAEAGELIRQGGWQTLTMGKLADRVGVSRQTVYNEIGSKQQLAEAVVMQEMGVFLAQVDEAFLQNPEDIVAAVRSASRTLLETAEENPLLVSILTRSSETADLLALITTQAAPLIEAAKLFVADHIGSYDLGLDEERLEVAVDAVVRILFSHVTQPGFDPPEVVAEHVAWLADRVLNGS
jgi:AcrR family transcriptional regulator